MGLEAIDFQEGEKILMEKSELLVRCREKGHPHTKKIIVPYIGKSKNVTEQCGGCGEFLYRPARKEEVKNYYDMLRITINI